MVSAEDRVHHSGVVLPEIGYRSALRALEDHCLRGDEMIMESKESALSQVEPNVFPSQALRSKGESFTQALKSVPVPRYNYSSHKFNSSSHLNLKSRDGPPGSTSSLTMLPYLVLNPNITRAHTFPLRSFTKSLSMFIASIICLFLISPALGASSINITYSLIQDEGKPCFPMDSCERPDVKLFPERADRKLRNCECDPLCSLYGDCCIDSNRNPPTNDSNNPSKSSSPLRSTPFSTHSQTNWTCAYVSGFHHIYLVKSCPLDRIRYDAVLVQKCQHPDLSHPLQFIPYTDGRTNYTYANVYCAMCNSLGNSFATLTPWASTITCDFKVEDSTSVENFLATHLKSRAGHNDQSKVLKRDDYQKLLLWTDMPITPNGSNTGKCWWKFTAPPGQSVTNDETIHATDSIRKCVPDVINDCSVVHTNEIATSISKREESKAAADLKTKCKSYTARVWTASRRVYRNSHCALCNGERASDISCYDIFSQPLPIYDPRYYYNSPRNARSHFRLKLAWQILSDGNVADPLHNCRPGNFWDPFEGRCVSLHRCVSGTGYVASGQNGSSSCQTLPSTRPTSPALPTYTASSIRSTASSPYLDLINVYGSPIPCLSPDQKMRLMDNNSTDVAAVTVPVISLSPRSYHLIGESGIERPEVKIHVSSSYELPQWHGIILDRATIYFTYTTAGLHPLDATTLNGHLMTKPTLFVCEETLYATPSTKGLFPHLHPNDHYSPEKASVWAYTCKRKRIVSYLALVVSAAIYAFYAILSLCRMFRRPGPYFADANSMLTLVHVLECAALNGLLVYALFYYNSFTLPPLPTPSVPFQPYPHYTAANPLEASTSPPMPIIASDDRCKESYYMSEHVGILIKSRLSVNVLQPLLVFLIFSCLFWILSYALHHFFRRANGTAPQKSYRESKGDDVGDSIDNLKKEAAGGGVGAMESSIMSGSSVVQRISKSRPIITFIIFQCSSWCLAFLMTALFYLTATLSLNRSRGRGNGLGYFFALNQPPSSHDHFSHSGIDYNDSHEMGMWDTPGSLGTPSAPCSCSCLPAINRFFGLAYLLPVNLVTTCLALVLITWAMVLASRRYKLHPPTKTHYGDTHPSMGSYNTPSPPLYDVRRAGRQSAHQHTRGGGKYTGRGAGPEEDKTSSSSSSGCGGAQSSCSATDDSLLHNAQNPTGLHNDYDPYDYDGTITRTPSLLFPEIHAMLLVASTFTQFLLLSAAAASAHKVIDRSCSLYWIFFVVLGNLKAILVCASRYRPRKTRMPDEGKTFRSISPIAGKGDNGGGGGYGNRGAHHVKYTYNPLATTGSYDVSGVVVRTEIPGGNNHAGYPTLLKSSPKYHESNLKKPSRNGDKFMELALGEDKARLHSVRDIEVV